VLNFLIGLAFLLPFQSWHSIVAATSELGLFAYSITAVAQAAFRRAEPGNQAGWIRGTTVLAPVSFIIATLILYWATWQELRIALPVLLVGAVVYGIQQVRGGVDWQDVRVGLWLSGLGSFGGTGLIPAPWDSVIVAAVGLAAFLLGVRHALAHLAAHPAPAPEREQQPQPGSPGRAAETPAGG
jgi:amino acid transporter